MSQETQTRRDEQDLRIREADPSDRDDVQTVARRSLQTSYALSPGVIDAALHAWYEGGTFEAKLERSEVVFLVAEANGDVAGFTESALTAAGDGDLRWLHVVPARRGEGIASRLYERTRTELEAAGADRIRGAVLQTNAEGTAFYERRGLERAATAEVEIDGTAYKEHVYLEPASASLLAVTTADGRKAYADTDETDAGSNAPFHPVYTDRECETKLGSYCANCESVATAMGPMGRLQCQDCGNLGQPTRWDAAYL
jgi:ribosomal protein S18 acetylase RimI-like enzyme